MVTAIAGMFLSTKPAGMVPWHVLGFASLGLAMAMAASAVINHVVDQKIDGDNATLTLIGGPPNAITTELTDANKESKTEGTVTLTREHSVWKIVKESWKSKEVITDPAPTPQK